MKKDGMGEEEVVFKDKNVVIFIILKGWISIFLIIIYYLVYIFI